jgi:YbbR domain-containing protein
MRWLRGILLGNWPLKLAAVTMATVLYASVALSENTRSWSGPVPIEVLGAPAGGSLLELPGSVTEIRFRAPLDVASQLTAGSFRASVNLSVVQPRIGAAPVAVPVDVIAVDPRVRLVDHEPRFVNVRVDQVVTRGMPVVIDHGPIPEGIEIGPISVEPDRVSVRGASSRVANIRSVAGRVAVDGSGINIDQDVTVEAFDEVGSLVPGVDIDPPSVRVSADVARRLGYATLPVVPQLTGEPADGYRIGHIRVIPPTVTVGGEDPAVRSLTSVTTEPIDISGLDGQRDVEVALRLPAEVSEPDEAQVRVRLDVEPQDASRAVEIGTALVGPRSDRTYRLEDGSVRVIVAGPVPLLDALSARDLIAEVPVAGLDVGTHAVDPIVRLPEGLEAVLRAPEQVRVTIAPVDQGRAG